MDRQARRAAREAFEKRKIEVGIYRLTCAPTRQVWVGKSRNLAAVMNRLAMSVQGDPVLNAQFKASWHSHGADAFRFEVLEVLDPETPTMFINSTLKKRLDYWKAERDAEIV